MQIQKNSRWELCNGAYYFQVPPGLEYRWDGQTRFRLGRTLREAAETWEARTGVPVVDRPNLVYVRELLDRYRAEVLPAKAAVTRALEAVSLVNLNKAFGDMRIVDVSSDHLDRYIDTRLGAFGRNVRSTAQHEVFVLRHAYTKAVAWGVLAKHPFKGDGRPKCVRVHQG